MKNILVLFFLISISCLNAQQSSKLLTKEGTKILPVPYLAQPTNITCQSTCLKMVAMYFKNVKQSTNPNQSISFPSADKGIEQIWNEVNKGTTRPSKERNDWANFIWWLNTNIPNKKFGIKSTADETEAIPYIIKAINAGNPVMLSTNHTRVQGHIVLIVGYINYTPNQSTTDFRLICHDPYGAFYPELSSTLFGKKRFDVGSSNIDGSEEGSGKSVELSPESIKRNRKELHNAGKYVMMTGVQ
jgi:hypothetical protein